MIAQYKSDEFDTIDFFTDKSLTDDPHSYFEYLRAQGPAVRLPHRGVVAVTDYDTALAIFRSEERFSSFNAAYGPNPLPFTPQGDDITEQIASNRGELSTFNMISSYDPPEHTRLRMLLKGLLTPKRLQENERFMWPLADGLIDEMIDHGSVEFISRFAGPFATLVVADLLGVPEEDHRKFRRIFSEAGLRLGSIDGMPPAEENPLTKITGYFHQYIEDRRRSPRKDVLTDLALAKYPDGSLPPIDDVVELSAFLFAAGQETTVRVMGALMSFICEDRALQERLRADRSLIPNFVEETLRMEGSVKSGFRLAKVHARIGDVDVAPGTPIMLCISSLNRDPGKFDEPNVMKADRKNARDHLAFGRGIHSCIGAPLARAELKVALECMFDRTTDIRFDEARHGPEGRRSFEFIPSFVVRGMTELHLNLSPARR
jgi:cytochrome P450